MKKKNNNNNNKERDHGIIMQLMQELQEFIGLLIIVGLKMSHYTRLVSYLSCHIQRALVE